MHINSIKINDLWVSFDIENVKAKKGDKTSESVQAVATFTKAGQQVTKIYKLGNFDYCAKLLNRDFAQQEAQRIIESHNVSELSPFKN